MQNNTFYVYNNTVFCSCVIELLLWLDKTNRVANSCQSFKEPRQRVQLSETSGVKYSASLTTAISSKPMKQVKFSKFFQDTSYKSV